MNRKKYIQILVFSSIIAAAYAALTYLSAFFGLAYGSVQFRVSEVLTILPCFTPYAIPGLVVGCILGNIGSFNPIDMIIGTSATLIAAIFTYLLRKVKTFNIPLLSLLSPVIFNAVIVGFEIAFIFMNAPETFLINALWVGLGEIVICLGLGTPFYIVLNKHSSIFDHLN